MTDVCSTWELSPYTPLNVSFALGRLWVNELVSFVMSTSVGILVYTFKVKIDEIQFQVFPLILSQANASNNEKPERNLKPL